LALRGDKATIDTFRADYGNLLIIFETGLLDSQHVHYLKSIEGLEQTISRNTISPPDLETTTDRSVTSILTRLDNQWVFSTRVTLHRESDRITFYRSPEIGTGVIAPCSVEIEYGMVTHLIQVSFPIERPADREPLRGKGWFEISFLLRDPDREFNKNVPPDNVFRAVPVDASRTDSVQCSWNLPLVNFSRLPLIKLNNSTRQEHDLVLNQLLQAREFNRSNSPELIELKSMILTMLKDTTSSAGPKVLGISYQGEIQLLFFVTGVFIDDSSQSIIAETFFLDPIRSRFNRRNGKLNIKMYRGSPNQIAFWKQCLLSMIERCRDWSHHPHCEYQLEAGPAQFICSCGKGRTNANFSAITEWAEFGPDVVRCAISPIFPAPRFQPVQNVCVRCAAPGATKKCGRCLKVFYCGAECQKADWKLHKLDCRAGN
jgi:MYND finger